jgi:hypothetical protein
MGTFKELPAYFSKRVLFLLLNLVMLISQIVTGVLRWEVASIVGCAGALIFMNWMALIASRKYKGKYQGW